MRLLPVLLFLITSVAECLMLSRVLVPQYKLYGEDALLKCDYDLGRDRLYAVKWYKDNEEFFRYIPRFNPPIYTHPVEGVRVESIKSNDKRVQLRSLTVKSTGTYRCEVSAEAPSFASIMGEGRMTVVYLPKDAPHISGNVRQEYEIGDVLDLNCTSAKSFPPAKISWYINDNPVDVPYSVSLHPASPDPPVQESDGGAGGWQGHQLQRHYSGGTVSVNSLMVSSLRLQLPLKPSHFGPKGTAKVRCVARISPLFWQDGDKKTLGHSQVTGSGGGSGHNHNSQRHHNANQNYRHQHTSKKTNALEEGQSTVVPGDDDRDHGDEHGDERHHSKTFQSLSTFGKGLPYQTEALVLVRSGCASHLGNWTTLYILCFCMLTHFLLFGFSCL